jgi:hypothetical protein
MISLTQIARGSSPIQGTPEQDAAAASTSILARAGASAAFSRKFETVVMRLSGHEAFIEKSKRVELDLRTTSHRKEGCRP